MAKKNEIIVKDIAIKTMSKDGIDYISITDIARQKNATDPNGVIANWMRNRNTVEFLGIWETLHNPNFNPLEFEGFRKLSHFRLLVGLRQLMLLGLFRKRAAMEEPLPKLILPSSLHRGFPLNSVFILSWSSSV